MARGLPLLRMAMALMRLTHLRKKDRDLSDGARLARALRHLGPAFIKLGQTLATRPDLVGDELAEELSMLQDSLPPFDEECVLTAIAEELGVPLSEAFSSFDSEPIAAASVAQVHFATTLDGQDVAVKILRPGIKRQFERDISTFYWVARIFERASSEMRRLRPVDIVATMEANIKLETDLMMEAAAAGELADNMAGFEGYRVPRVIWALTTHRILTTERIIGIPIGNREALVKAGHDTSKLARTIVSAFLRQSIQHGFFHADLHPGNLFVEADGTIVAVDFGIMGRLDENSRRFLGEILWGFQKRDYRGVAQVHFDAGYVPESESIDLFAQALRAIAEPIIDRPIRDISFGHLFAQLLATTRRFSMQTQPQLLMLQRSMVMVEGLALMLDDDASMWALSRPELERFFITQQKLPGVLGDLATKMPELSHIFFSLAERYKSTRDGKRPGAKDLRSLIAELAALVILSLIAAILRPPSKP